MSENTTANTNDAGNNPEEAPKNGNIWGWKFSYISLGIILATLLMVILFDENPRSLKPTPPAGLKNDTIEQVQEALPSNKEPK